MHEFLVTTHILCSMECEEERKRERNQEIIFLSNPFHTYKRRFTKYCKEYSNNDSW